MGHSEDVNMDKIKTFMEMDSHEEKLANIIRETQLDNAREKAKQRAKEIAESKPPKTGYGGGMGGMGNFFAKF